MFVPSLRVKHLQNNLNLDNKDTVNYLKEQIPSQDSDRVLEELSPIDHCRATRALELNRNSSSQDATVDVSPNMKCEYSSMTY